jgi:transcriptional regulator with XRE-family HTH domain
MLPVCQYSTIISLTYRQQFLKFNAGGNMSQTQKFPVPEGFGKLFNEAIKRNPDLSLREVARRWGMSPSFLVRILAGERGLPDDKKLLDLARALNIVPPERLLIEAGRVTKPKQKILLRSLSALSDADMEKVLKFTKKLEDKKKS